MEFTIIWFNKDKLLVWLWNAPLESVMKEQSESRTQATLIQSGSIKTLLTDTVLTNRRGR